MNNGELGVHLPLTIQHMAKMAHCHQNLSNALIGFANSTKSRDSTRTVVQKSAFRFEFLFTNAKLSQTFLITRYEFQVGILFQRAGLRLRFRYTPCSEEQLLLLPHFCFQD